METPLTREAITAEIGKAMSDPTHAQHTAFMQGLPSYGKFADALYARLAPDAPAANAAPQKTVEIDESGIEIGPDGLKVAEEEPEPDYAHVQAALAQYWPAAETESRMENVATFLKDFSPAEKALLLTLGDRLQDDVLAMRVLDAIVRKVKATS